MAMVVGAKGGAISAINVTPLVDVVLVLLIIFMVVTPMLQRGKDVRLPKAEKISEEKGKSEPIILSVTPDKRMYFDKYELGAAQMKERIAQELVAAPGKPIMLKGDQSLTYGDVRRLMKIAKEAGAKGIGLAVEEIKK